MNRVLQPEILDELPASDPRAAASRRDLRVINKLMGNHRPIVKFLQPLKALQNPAIAEIGAGEGLLSLALARSVKAPGRILLIDQQPVVSAQTLADISAAGWTAEAIAADVFEWLRSAPRVEAICASLFLHHFEGARLRELLALIAGRADFFAASEPLRDPVARWFARKLWLIGCNEVTLHDGEISVRAGFCGRDLSPDWPEGWSLTEKRHRLFTHFFGARRQA